MAGGGGEELENVAHKKNRVFKNNQKK